MFPSQQYWLKIKRLGRKKKILSLIKDFVAGTGEWIGLASECGWMQKHLGTNPVCEGMVGLTVMSLVPISLLDSVLQTETLL